MTASLFPWRPIGRDGFPRGAGFCSLPSKHPPVESGGERQIRHTPRYPVALGPCGESLRNPPSYALDRRLGLRKKHGMWGAKRPRGRLGPYIRTCRQGGR